MPKVNLPRASWDEVLLLISLCENAGMYNKAYIHALYKEIEDQVYSQEY